MTLEKMVGDATWPDNRNLSGVNLQSYDIPIKHPGPRQTHHHSLDLWTQAHRPLYGLLGERPLVVVFSMGFRQIVETSDWCRRNLGVEVLWISRVIQGMRHEKEQDIIGADFKTVSNFFELRQRRDNVVMCFVHMAAPHTAPWHVKKQLPGVKALSIIYDCMDLWLPPDKLHLWDQYVMSKGSNRGEYTALKDLEAGEYIEGLVYKDWGPGWPKFQGCKCPTAWMPSTLPQHLFQNPPPLTVPDRFAFIGTIMPKSTHEKPAGLFSDIMMENVFGRVARQGYDIHAYVLKPHPEVLKEYRNLFPAGHRVKLFPGDLLGRLLERMQGRYKWGWMMYEYPEKSIIELPRNSLPTKLFTYMALGMPMVVSEEMEAVARLVKQEDIGVVVSQRDIDNLKPILDAQDYPKLVENILAARKRYCLEAHIKTFGDMLMRVMDGPCKPVPDNPLFLKHEAEYVKKMQQVQSAQQKEAAAKIPTGSSWRYAGGEGPMGEDEAALSACEPTPAAG